MGNWLQPICFLQLIFSILSAPLHTAPLFTYQPLIRNTSLCDAEMRLKRYVVCLSEPRTDRSVFFHKTSAIDAESGQTNRRGMQSTNTLHSCIFGITSSPCQVPDRENVCVLHNRIGSSIIRPLVFSRLSPVDAVGVDLKVHWMAVFTAKSCYIAYTILSIHHT